MNEQKQNVFRATCHEQTAQIPQQLEVLTEGMRCNCQIMQFIFLRIL